MNKRMHAKTVSPKNKRRWLGVSLSLFLGAIYLLVYRGGFHSVDEVSMFAVTESLVKFGQVNTDQIAWTQWTTSQAEAQGFFGPDGHVYSKKGLALSLAQAPLYWLALYLPGVGMLQLVSTLNALITATTGLLIFMFAHRLGFSQRTSLLTALIFGVATIAFVYAKYLFSEPLAGFLLLLAAYMLVAYRQEGGLRHIILAGLAAGAAVLARANNLFLLPVFGLYLLWVLVGQRANQRTSESANQTPSSSGTVLSPHHPVTLSPRHFVAPVLTFVGAVSLIGAILLGYNAIRSGNPFQTGYDLTLFSPNILLGLYKLLFSPLRGFFIYSPILLLSLPGWWWWLRRQHPTEAWLLAGLVGVTILLFSAWSSGEGLSWGSRFLVPLAPFFAVCLAPVIEASGVRYQIASSRGAHSRFNVQRFIFYALLIVSLLIQILGVAINPWVFLSQIQTEFGGEFFLENTAALYDFRYSQIAGQIQAWSIQNSDVVWWQPWGFDGLAFGLSLLLVGLTGWQLWTATANFGQEGMPKAHKVGTEGRNRKTSPLRLRTPAPLLFALTVAITYFLLTRYHATDRQFGPPDDPYTRALTTAAAQTAPEDQLVTVAQYHYHVPMNRFKARLPLVGLAQQSWPPPETFLPLLNQTLTAQNIWLVTVGFPPAAPDNAAERWLSENAFLAGSEWFDDVRLVRFGAHPPTTTRPVNVTLGSQVQLVEVKLTESLQPGQTLPVEFVWQALKQPQADYNLFLQLLSPDGRLIAQQDSPPNGGYSPTSAWRPAQPIITRLALVIPADLPEGEYRLIAGLYNPASGQRLATAGGGDFVELGSIALNVKR